MFAAWLSYITSLFLPTAVVWDESVTGWAAALFSIQSIVWFYNSLYLTYLSLLGLCNILMILSPVIVIYTFKKKGYLVYRLLILTAAITAGSYFFYEGFKFRFFELKAGYYFWALSFILASVSLFFETRFYYRHQD